jgi:hypothetical protein
MASIPLLTKKGEDEESSLKRWLSYAFFIVTIFLMALNVSGAWIGSNGNIFYTGSIAGAELFVALALGALIYTRNNLRFGVGLAVFAVGVWITLENGKMAVTHAMDNVFTGTPVELRELADLADTRADELDTDATDSKQATTGNLTAIRSEIAELRAEQRILGSSDVEGIQRKLQASGYYTRATLDGVRGVETERGIVLRGEEIRLRLGVLAEMETMATKPPEPAAPVIPQPSAPTDAVALSPAEAKRKEAIDLRKQAKEVEERTVWMNVLLVGLEGIRSLALWVFLMDGTMTAARLRKRAYDQLKLAEINFEIAGVNAKIAALNPAVPSQVEPVSAPRVEPVAPSAAEPAPVSPAEPVEAPPAPEPPPPLPELELTQAQIWGREGAKQAHLNRKAEEARAERVLVIGPVSTLDAIKVAAE